MKDPFAVIPAGTASIFKLLQEIPWLGDFILIGGTALALHIGHRKSEDLDFITLRPRLPRALLTRLEEALREQNHAVTLTDDPAASDEFEIAGMDIRDYNQDWLIDDSVKLTLFTADDHHKRILTGPDSEGGFRFGTLRELCELKAIVASGRSKSRDWVDLFVLERDFSFGLAGWKQAYDKAGLTAGQFETAVKRICSGIVSPPDEGFEMLMQDPPSVQEIATHFQKLRDAYEINVAKNILRAEE